MDSVGRVRPRLATVADVDAVVETITLAFFDDPVWSWAFPTPASRAEQYRAWWRPFIAASISQSAVWLPDDLNAAAAVWVPPGGFDLLPEDAERTDSLLRALVGEDRAEIIQRLNLGFEEHHPDEPFHYLSLLGTHPDHRGHGLGMALLESRLRQLDELKEPSLLESSNPVNHERYKRLGFSVIDEWRAPDEGPPVVVMWRPAR